MKNIIIVIMILIFCLSLGFANEIVKGINDTQNIKESIIIDSYELYKLQLFHNYPIFFPDINTAYEKNIEKINGTQRGLGSLVYYFLNICYFPINIIKTPFVALTIFDRPNENFK